MLHNRVVKVFSDLEPEDLFENERERDLPDFDREREEDSDTNELEELGRILRQTRKRR